MLYKLIKKGMLYMVITNQLKDLLNSHSNVERIFVSVGHPSQKALVKCLNHIMLTEILKIYRSISKNTGKKLNGLK